MHLDTELYLRDITNTLVLSTLLQSCGSPFVLPDIALLDIR